MKENDLIRRKYALIKKKMQELSHDDFVRWEERMKELAWRRSAIGRKHMQLMHEHELLVCSNNRIIQKIRK